MRYVIRETLEPAAQGQAAGEPFVAVLTPAEWAAQEGSFDMGIDLEPDAAAALDVQAEVNFDSVTGAITLPDRSDLSAPPARFAFALDEKGVVFIDAGAQAARLVDEIARTRRWRQPGLERFLYDFLCLLVRDDPAYLSGLERELDRMEAAIYAAQDAPFQSGRINEIRSALRDLDDYLEHLQDFAAVLEENENGFFRKKELRYFRLFAARVEKLRDKVSSLREQAVQLRDLHKTHLDIRQNRIMTVLTVVTTIFAPLTLIAGWYGMNFANMPELAAPWGYPAVIAASAAVTIGLVAFFRHIKWL